MMSFMKEIKRQRNISDKEIMFVYSFVFLFFVFTYSLTAQNKTQGAKIKNEVKGYIVDAQTGEPLVFANVVIKNTVIGAATNKSGFFVILDVPAGKHNLVVSYIGYRTKEIEIELKDGKDEELKIKLESQDIQSKEINVVADHYKFWKTAGEVSQITISPMTLSKLPNLGEKDIFRSLQLLPGISSLNDGSSGLYVRGGTPDQNLILLDGITVYHVDHFFGFFSAFNSDAIKDVQLYKGGFDARFGGRVSSVVDLTGKTGDMEKFRLSLSANLLSVNGVLEIPLFEKGSVLISARRSYADIINSGFYDEIYGFLTGGETTQSNVTQRGPGGFGQQQSMVTPSFYFYDLNIKASYKLADKDFLSFSIYNGKDYLDQSQKSEQVTLRNNSTSAIRTNEDLTDWGNLGGSIKWTRQWSDLWFSDLTMSYSNYLSKNETGSQFDQNVQNTGAAAVGSSTNSVQNNEVKDMTIKFDNEFLLSKDHNTSFGLWFSDLSTNYIFTVNDTLSILNRSQKGFQFAGYLQDKWKISELLEFKFGLRQTYFSPTKKNYLEPRTSFQYKLSDLIKIKGAWGVYNQYINQITHENVLEGSRDFWLISSDELKPISSTHYILGAEFETSDYLFSIEGYYKKLDNLLEYSQRIVRSQGNRLISSSNYESNFYQGEGFSEGLEFLIQKKFGNFNGWICYTLGKVEYTFPDFDDGNPFPAKQDKTNEVKVIGSYETGDWNFSASWVYSTGLPYTAPESQYFITLLNGETQSYIHVSDKNSYRFPDYHRLDVSASYKFRNRSFDGELGLSVFNLYNRNNIWYKKYDLTVSPIEVTNVSMLGIIPTIFFKVNF
ncbi:MAG: TonB-dependent receptor [Bacteroidetes bacterium]|nr:TonB-dependent receptor [Bacteroidota bacterium]